VARSSLKLIGFDKLKDILDPKKFEKRLKKHVEAATTKNGIIAEGQMKKAIDKGRIKSPTGAKVPNAPLTVVMKGSDRPLVDSGQLKQSISSRVKRWDLALVGVNRNKTVTKEGGGKSDILSIAKTLHDGARIKVTTKMRSYFEWLAFNDDSPFKGVVRPLKPGTKVIVIPARPFTKVVLVPRLVKKYKENWDEAVKKAMHGKN
jgi:phage gpG-like protein